MRKATVVVLAGLFVLGSVARPAQAEHWRRYPRHRSHRSHHRHHGDGLAIAAGVLAGAILLDVLTSPRTETVVVQQPVYAPPPVVYAPPPVLYRPPPVVYRPPVVYQPPGHYSLSVTIGPYTSWRHPPAYRHPGRFGR